MELAMTRRARLTVAALTAAASSGHLLYPAWLALASRRRPAPAVGDPEQWPAVTVVVAAYNESAVIGAKVRDVLGNGYPGPLEVMVVADADLDTAERAEEAGATVITADDRLGKSQALNLGMSKVTTPVVVMSDANNFLAPGALAAMVRYFADPAVGAVAGEKVEAGGGGEDIYWRFESWLKQREWRLGTTIGLVGELAAIRTEAWRPIPADIASDDLWMALDLAARGYAIAYEPAAKAFEPPGLTMGQHWERRARVVAGGLHVLVHHRSQLGPKGGLMAAEAWGHRLVRYTVTPVAHVALVWMALRRARASRLARLFLLGHVVAARSLVRQARQDAALPDPAAPPDHTAGGQRPRPAALVLADRAEKALGQAVFLDAVALKGIVRYLGGDRQTRWTMVRHGRDHRRS
jgi:cellulose synthase/poly-beta-1,6-N-acetylglucosamine synthase-like glycosyltransferase